MIKDVYKRPFITAGFTAFLLMGPLAVTSTSGMIRRGRQTVANAASPGLRQRYCRRDSLLLAREIRRDLAATLRRHRRHSAPLPCAASGFPWTYPTKSRARQCRTGISISEVIANEVFQLAKDSVDRNCILSDGFLWIYSK